MCRNTDVPTDAPTDVDSVSTTEEKTPPVTKHSLEEILQWEGGGVGDNCGNIGIAPKYRKGGR